MAPGRPILAPGPRPLLPCRLGTIREYALNISALWGQCATLGGRMLVRAARVL